MADDPPSLSQTCQRRTIRMIRAIRTIRTATMPRRKLRFLRSLGVTMSRMLRIPRRMQMRPRKGRHPHPPHPLRSPRSKSGRRPGVARSRPLHRCPPAPGAEKRPRPSTSNRHLIVCWYGRKCNRTECWFKHPDGRECDERKGKGGGGQCSTYTKILVDELLLGG